MDNILYSLNKHISSTKSSLDYFKATLAQETLSFHKSFKEYQATPLHVLDNLAKDLKVNKIFLKDESLRFGLNAFKVLGGSYAIGKYLAKILNCDIKDLTREKLSSPSIKDKLGDITFTSATDGNHGRGVAWTAQQLGQKAVIFMPKGADKSRVNNILATGAQCNVTDLNYDDAVRLANEHAEKYGWVMVQDTAWEGYEEIPTWIMQGYMTLANESYEQMRNNGIDYPTHLFLQAGVGSFAGAVLGFFASIQNGKAPITTIVEPHKANCHYISALANDNNPHAVKGSLDTLMAGLACGEPCTVSWNIIRDYASAFISCDDYFSANGMRILSSPIKDDPRVISGESGAVTTGILEFIMRSSSLKAQELRKSLHLDERSNILLISTEGDTSPKTYRDVVWFGQYPDKGV